MDAHVCAALFKYIKQYSDTMKSAECMLYCCDDNLDKVQVIPCESSTDLKLFSAERLLMKKEARVLKSKHRAKGCSKFLSHMEKSISSHRNSRCKKREAFLVLFQIHSSAGKSTRESVEPSGRELTK
jgi:hypothetical protein